MTSINNYTTRIFKRDKSLLISTVSPNGNYYYKIKELRDLRFGTFCCPIAFFDKDDNLIYQNRTQYAQYCLIKTKEWELVSWSKSGDIAFFIERNSVQTLHYILLDLKNKAVSKTAYESTEKYTWTSELFNKLPEDKAREAYFKINSSSNEKELFNYVMTLHLIDDKRALIKSLEEYYFNFKSRLQLFSEGNFDESIISNSEFDNFKSITQDKLHKGLFELLGFNKWRP